MAYSIHFGKWILLFTPPHLFTMSEQQRHRVSLALPITSCALPGEFWTQAAWMLDPMVGYTRPRVHCAY